MHDHGRHAGDHGHGHGHSHAHGHAHGPQDFGRAFAIGTALNLALVVAEVGFGLVSQSLALVSDGVHNLSDVLGLLLAWGAAWLARRQPTRAHTYGYRRASILAALANAGLLFAATGAILIEAVRRFAEPAPVASTTVVWVAALAVVINTATALVFMRGRAHDINIGAAVLHMVADAAISVGVVVAALVIGATGWTWVDPMASIAIALAIIVATWRLARDALDMALDAVPRGIDPADVEAYLAGLPGVVSVHDLHIWPMSTTETALTAHLVRADAAPDDRFLAEAVSGIQHRFGIGHATLQVECGDEACRLAPAHVV
jgi:cobalt-zinc-cadmium efflux system protein